MGFLFACRKKDAYTIFRQAPIHTAARTTPAQKLYKAIETNNLPKVKKRLKQGVYTPGLRNDRRQSPLHWAAIQQNRDIFDCLINYCLKNNYKDEFSAQDCAEQTVFHKLAKYTSLSMIKQLYNAFKEEGLEQAKALLVKKDRNGSNVLHKAVRQKIPVYRFGLWVLAQVCVV